MSTVQPSKKKKGIITPVFRVSFPHWFAPWKGENSSEDAKAKYGNMAIFVPGEMDIKDKGLWSGMIALANDAAVKTFGKPLKELPPNFKKPFHRGDEKAEYGMTEKMIYTNLTSHVKPEIRMPDGVTKLPDYCKKHGKTVDELIFAGIYCRASVNAFAFKKGGGKGVAFGLNGVLFVKSGERLDNRALTDEEFEDFIDPEFNSGAAIGGGDDDLGLDGGLDSDDDDLGL